MALYDVTQAPYNAQGDYNYATNTGTNDAPAIAQAINDARAAGGGTVYIPTAPNGDGYLLTSAGDAINFPDSIFPILDVSGVRVIGDAVAQGGTQLIVGVDKDVFRIGQGDGTGDWPGVSSPAPEGYEISGFTIAPRKGFYHTKVVFHSFNSLSVDIHHFNITDYGFAYGVPAPTISSVFCTYPSGPNAGWPYAKLPRPGVTTDPRGAGWQSADMGRLGIGTKLHGFASYKVEVHDGQINGTEIGCEVGAYNDNFDTPQKNSHRKLIVARCHTAGCVQYGGDGSNEWTDVYSFQHAGNAFWYIIPANASGTGLPYSASFIRCGADWIGGHGFHIDGNLGGSAQLIGVSMVDCYAAGAGVAEMSATPWPTPGSKKGVLFDNNRVTQFTIKGLGAIVNTQDGCEVTCTQGPGIIWDSQFNYNGTNGGGSGLYVNNNSRGLNIQRNTFDGAAWGPFVQSQTYGLYFNNTNIQINSLIGNVAVNNITAQYNMNGLTPAVSGLNV